MQKQLIGLAIAFAVLSILFGIAQRIWPSVRGQKTFRRGFLTDCIYWLWAPVVARGITPLAIAIALMPLAVLHGTSLKALLHGFGTVGAQPLLLQGVEIFVLADFLGYWQHRLFHGRALWPFHAIHHSSTDLDWLSSVRLHPVNDVISRLIIAVRNTTAVLLAASAMNLKRVACLH